MRYGSLFSGIGGLDLGLERAGMEVRWQVEIDPFCRKVLAKHWPDVRRYEDVRDVGAHNLEPVDMIAGGFPCQDISVAGRGEGIDGERSGLWSEFSRIVRELRPRYVLVENVSALLVRGIDRVLGDLAEIGYDAEWDCIPAAALGAPHRRDRVFVVGYSVESGLEGYTGNGAGGVRHERQVSEQDRPTGTPGLRGGARSLPDPDPQRLQGRRIPEGEGRAAVPDPGWGGSSIFGEALRYRPEWAPEPDVGRVADGIPDRVDRIRALGNAVVPQVAEWIGRRILEATALPTDSETRGGQP